MKLNRIGSIWDRRNRNAINTNWERLEGVLNSINDLVLEGTLSDSQYIQLLKELNGLISRGDVSVHDIDKNKGLFDQSFLSEELLAQIAGTSPVLSTLADGTVTTNKVVDGAITPEKTNFHRLSNINRNLLPGSIDVDGTIRYRTSWHGAILDRRVFLPKGTRIGLYNYDKHNINVSRYDYRTGEWLGSLGRGEKELFLTEDSWVQIMPNKKDVVHYTDEELKEVGDLLYVLSEDDAYYKSPLYGKEFLWGSVDVDGRIRYRDEWHLALLSDFLILDENVRIGLKDYSKFNLNVSIHDLSSDDPTYNYGGSYGRGERDIITDRRAKFMITPGKKDGTNFTINELKECFDLLFIEEEVAREDQPRWNAFERVGILENVNEKFELMHVENFNQENRDAENVQHDEIYDLYEDLRNSHSSYISRAQIGASTEGIPLYKYTFKHHNTWEFRRVEMDRKIPKIFITCGVHGHEKSPVFTVYNLMKLITNHWRENEFIEYLRFNVEFVVIPLVNPDGFDLHNRHNANSVDINRDFPEAWTRVESGYAQNGPEPLSQVETNHIYDEMKKNTDAVFGIDFHNMTEQDGHITYTTTGPDNDFMKRWSQNTMLRCTRKWQKRYANFPQDEEYEFGYTSTSVGGSTSRMMNAEGIPAMTLEISKTIAWESNKLYDDAVMETGLELLVEIIRDGIKSSVSN